MKCKRNWFYDVCVLLLGFVLLYAFWCSFTVQSQSYVTPSLFRAGLLLGLFGGLVTARFLAWLSALCKLEQIFGRDKKWVTALEAVVVVAVLAAAVFLRLEAVSAGSHIMNAQENVYYEIASLQSQGTLLTQGAQYCEMIANNPNLLGYSFFLKIAFSFWGTRMESGQYLNIFFSVAAVFFLYLTLRKLSGRIAGMTALLLGAFSVELIQDVLVLSEEMAFLFFAFGGSALLAHLLTKYDKDRGKAGVCFTLCIVLGVFLAVGAVVNPWMALFVAAVFLVLLFQKMELPNKPLNDIPLMLRFIHYGWVRCLLVLVPFLLLYAILLSNIEMTINRDAAWFNSFTWENLLNLTEKYELLWGGAAITGIWGAAVLFAGMLGLLALFRSAGSFLYIYVLWFLGAMGSNLLLVKEAQLQRLLLFLLILFAAHGLGSLFTEAVGAREKRKRHKELSQKQEEEKQAELDTYKRVEEEVEKLRGEALANVFDMQYALEHGHVIMTVSEAYRQEKGKEEEKTKADEGSENGELPVKNAEPENPVKVDGPAENVKAEVTGAEDNEKINA